MLFAAQHQAVEAALVLLVEKTTQTEQVQASLQDPDTGGLLNAGGQVLAEFVEA